MKKLYYILITILVCSSGIFAQDGQYSQYTNAPMRTNPAFTGAIDGKYRIGLNYRSQWAAVNAPYQNMGLYADFKHSVISAGAMINKNAALDAGFETTNIEAAVAIHKKLAEGKNQLSLGVQAGLLQQRINTTLLTFDNQYNPELGFDPSLASNEAFEFTQILVPNLNAGLIFQFDVEKQKNVSGQIGLSIHHINQPAASFMMQEVFYPMKWGGHAQVDIKVADQMTLQPGLHFQRQHTASEMQLRGILMYDSKPGQQVYGGLGMRPNDAFILMAGLRMRSVDIGLSYDSNSSNLRTAGVGNHALELSASITIGRPVPTAPKKNELDRDGDGLIDEEDDCPLIPGKFELNGCPEAGVRDIDKDGILDENDLCPYVPGLVKYQGCNDSDQDGVWDHADACPKIPGKVENYGCPTPSPDKDSDQDGVLDKHDKCIYVKGLPALMGCPDTDLDGISDLEDNCPYVKGDRLHGGCPGQSNNTVYIPQARREIAVENVEFETDKSVIQPYYFEMLDRVANQMIQNPQYRLELEGHTDSEGSHVYNIHLSQRRAYAVQQYLLERGVSHNQLLIRFFGESRPLERNSTGFGKARNRRTELILLEQ